jgi:hypothetical protein
VEDKGDGGFQVTLVITRYPPKQLTRATTLPRYGTGLSPKFICFSAGSLTLYKGFVGSRNPGCRKSMGNSESGSFGIYPAGRHLGSPAVALELHSGKWRYAARVCRGG